VSHYLNFYGTACGFGLRLTFRPCLNIQVKFFLQRESDGRTEFLGAELPWPDAKHAVERTSPRIVAFSSRSSEPFHHDDFAALVEQCASHHAVVVTGGEWARGGTATDRGYLRFRSLRGFEKWLRSQ